MTIVQLSECRGLLADLEEVRKRILQGDVSGFTVCVLDRREGSDLFLGGACKLNKGPALKATMGMAMELNKRAAAPPRQRTGSS